MSDRGSGVRTVSAERWREMSAIVDEALELPPAERGAFISQRYAQDDPLRRELERFLAACEEVERKHHFLDDGAEAVAAPVLADLSQGARRQVEAQRQRLGDALSPRYRIERELGQGGMAAVYLAHDTVGDRHVAIKVLRQELAQYIGAERFVREIRITSQLAHPRIVPLLDSGSTEGMLYYTMPFIESGSLKDRLARDVQLSAQDVATLACDIAEALDFAHGHGILHRDIKPQNILMRDGRAVLADFGIARAIEVSGTAELTASAVIGTPPYMSPEQASAERRLDARSDIYSLGCVIYEALGGEPPYAGGSSQAIIAKHMHAPVPDVLLVRPSLSPAVQRVLSAALAKRPADRPSSAGEFARALAEALARPASASGARSPRRAWWARVGAGVLALSGIVAVGAALWRRDPPATKAGQSPRVAVLYLEDRSPRHDLTYLATGLTEDLIDALSDVRGLWVASPDAVRPYSDNTLPVDSIAHLLGASVLVSGSMTADAGRVRVTVRLTDGTTGELIDALPSQEQPSANVLAIRDSLVGMVVPLLRQRLGIELGSRERFEETNSPRAWELVQLGDQAVREAGVMLNQGTNALAQVHLARADSLYALAAATDARWEQPALGSARAAYSRTFLTPGLKGPDDPAMGAALGHAQEAVRRNPRSAETWAMLGQLHHLASLAVPSGSDSLASLAERELVTAIDRRPGFARALYWLGDLYYTQARFTESLRLLEEAYEADSFLAEARDVTARLFDVSLHVERFADARRWCELGRRRFEGDPRFVHCRLILLGWTGSSRSDVDEAWRSVYEIERQDAQGVLGSMWAFRRTMVAAVLARAGERDSTRALLRRMELERHAHPDVTRIPFATAAVWTLLGDRERALPLIASGIADNPRDRAYAARSPWFKRLHGDTRFRVIVGIAE